MSPHTRKATLPAEEYELASPTSPTVNALAGPSRPRRTSSNQAKTPRRTLTLHPNSTSSDLLFSAPSASLPLRGARQASNRDDTPRRAQFLREEQRPGEDDDEETVHFPDFSHMLGLDGMAGEDHFAVASGMRNRWKKRLYLLMEEPSSSREAFFLHIIVTGGILFSALLTTLSTLPSYHTNPSSVRLLFGLDTTVVVLFTIEYLARSLAHSDTLTQYYNWSTSFFAILDLIAILPYYIEVARNDDTSILFRFSILRTFRLLRVFRAFKYQNQMLLTIEVMYVAVRRSKDALVALSFFILLVLVFFATLIYFAERGTWDPNLNLFVDADGDPSLFDSIPQTAWFALVTMSTVGYGDVVPRSMLGKMLTVPLLMFGLLLIALPSFVLGRNFAIVFDAMTKQAQNPVSALNSPRISLETPQPPPRAASPSLQSTPLLPGGPPDQLPLPVSAAKFRAVSPLPNSANMAISGSASSQRGMAAPKMWDGGMEGLGATPGGAAAEGRKGDLTNVKLAKNQLVLLEQIESLRKTVERQNEMFVRLATALGTDLGLGMNGTGGIGAGEGLRRRTETRDLAVDEDEKQFSLGDGSGDER